MSLLKDVQLAARLLIKDRGVTFAAVAALALGIAATTTVFTIVNAVVLRPMPFQDPDRIVDIGTRSAAGGNRGVSYLDLQDWRARTNTFAGIAGFAQQTMNVSEDDRAPEQFAGAYISADAFTLVGHQPIFGRNFLPEDERPGAAPVVILGYAAWQTRYQSDQAIVGRTIRVNGLPSTVIGVMGEGVRFPFNADVWLPLTLWTARVLENRDARALAAFGRLNPDVTLEQARDDLGIVMAALGREFPATNADLLPRVAAFRPGAGPQIYVVIFALLGAVGFVLLIACANIANLLLARAVDRSREVSVRMAIGASRWHIVRQLLVESLLLSATAGIVGFALARVAVGMFVRSVTGTGEPYWLDFSMDPKVFGFFALICVGTAILFGLAPALHASRMNVNETLNESGRGSAGTLRARRWAGALVIAQLALAPVLLAGAGLMIRSLMAVYSSDAGIATAGLSRMRLNLGEVAYPTPERRAQFWRQLDDRLASSPGLRATLAVTAPQEGADRRQVSFEGRAEVPEAERPRVSLMTVGPRHFDTLGVPLLRGRDLQWSDATTGDIPALVNARFAAMYFPDEDPIGRRIHLAGGPLNEGFRSDWVTIVGLAPNIRQDDGDTANPREFDPIVYVSYAANPLSWTSILVRSEAGPGAITAQVRGELRAIDPDLPLFDIVTIDELLARERWVYNVFGTMFTAFGLIALVITTVGLYAVTARSVAQRTREIGVRMALGAQGKEVWWLVTRRVAIQVAAGLLIGMAGALGVGGLLESIIEVGPRDPVTMIGVPLLIVLVGVAAAILPARRAMRLDPVAALRHE